MSDQFEKSQEAYQQELESEVASLLVELSAANAKIAELGRLNTLLQERDGEFETH
jgi:hypothetical protein